jgi:hypothetical protein
MDSELSLPLSNMAERHSGLTPAVAEFYCEAARVCLDRHHSPPTSFAIVDQNEEMFATVEWLPSDERIRLAHANEIDATEAAAYACAIASTELTRGLFAVRRAETLTGADYYLAPAGVELWDLEECIRLEVSGTDKGELATMMSRLSEKVAQAKKGRSNLPAMAAVVGFRVKRILLKEVELP